MSQAWPSITSPSVDFTETLENPAIRTPFEAGYLQSRSKFTSAKYGWELKWRALSDTDWSTLKTFFSTYQGEIIEWTHPSTSATHNVVFVMDSLRGRSVGPDLWEVSVSIREV